MLGGGSFTTQNKTLPGTYINYVNVKRAGAALSDRGWVAVPLVLDWGPERTVFEVTYEEFMQDSQRLFGYSCDSERLMDLRELFANATKGIFYRLNAGEKAENEFASAKYSGVRGNDLMIVIAANAQDSKRFDVSVLLDLKEVDKQTVTSAGELAGNDYVEFKKDAALTVTAGTPLSGGTNGAEVTGSEHTGFLAAVEPFSFQVLCCPVTDDMTKALYIAYTKRLRDEAGLKFQTVVYRKEADYEGIISVENRGEEKEEGLVYWVAGAEAGCAVNKSNENRRYDGAYTVHTGYTQIQLAEGVEAGKFLFHKVGSEVRVLMDINTLVTYTEEKGEDFSSNQTIRVLDQIGNDIASLFNSRYLGRIPNDAGGRVSLWNDIVTYGKELAALRAIEPVKSGEIIVEKGNTKRSVTVSFPVEPINCMSQLYMTVLVS